MCYNAMAPGWSLVYLQELEKSLKATCEEFIMSVTKLVVDPMLSFVTKVCIIHLSLYWMEIISYVLSENL